MLECKFDSFLIDWFMLEVFVGYIVFFESSFDFFYF